MSTESATGITPNDLHAYFDDELLPDQAATVREALESDPQLKTEYEQLEGLQQTIGASFEVNAQAVPSARFEQIWDEIDRAIDRDERLQTEADRNASVWTRLWAALKPARVPVLAAAAAAAVTVMVVGPGADDANNPEAVASVSTEDTAPERQTEPATPETKVAVRTPGSDPKSPDPEPASSLSPMIVPETHEAEIHGIEFGGRSGRISNNGTVTVLYVEDDEASTNSERSL